MANFLRERPDPNGGEASAQPGTALVPAPTQLRARQANLHRCPNCGAINRGHASICPECGENLRATPRKIRCRQCGKGASSVLVICPHCGRELIAAPAQWLVWGIPAILVLLFLLLIASRWNALRPLGWLRSQLDAGTSLIQGLSTAMDPTVVIESTPASPAEVPTPAENGVDATPATGVVANLTPAEPVVEIAASLPVTGGEAAGLVTALTSTVVLSEVVTAPPPAPTEGATNAPSPTSPPTNTAVPTATPPPTETTAPSATATAAATATALPTLEPSATLAPTGATARSAAILLPTLTPTGQLTQTAGADPSLLSTPAPLASRAPAASSIRSRSATTTPTSTPTASPTETVTPPDTATPTEENTPTATPVPAVTYRVQPGDTLSAIAASTGASIDAIMVTNSLSAQDAYALRPGDELIIPGSNTGATQETAAPAAPTTPPRTYTVKSGDTPIAIATSLGVTLDALMAANNLNSDDARRLRTGQVLVVPGSAQGGQVIAPAAANPVAPSSAPQAIRLDPPQLRSPENNAQLSCNPGSTLVWVPVNFMRESDQYLLHLGFVNGLAADGRETITWVLEQVQGLNNTLWTMDPGLCGLAPQEYGRKWYWYVEVVEIVNDARVRVSAPSDSWAFSWN